MKLAAGIFLIIIGAFMLIKPKAMWKISEAWKTKNNAEPSKIYMVLIRIVGCILVIGGIFAMLD